MKKDDLLVRIALVGFHEFNAGGDKLFANGPQGKRFIFGGTLQSAHLMVDFKSSRVAEGYYSCATDGCQQLNTRNPDKVWNWVTEKLYSDPEKNENEKEKGLHP